MIYLIRHGLDDERYVGGYSEISLVSEGIKQVKEASEYIKNNLTLSKIYTSDIKRAVETADIINSYLNLEIESQKELRELDKGDLTGKRKDLLTEIELMNLNTKDINEKIFGGESMADLHTRINDLYANGYFSDKDNSLLVTHRGVINMLYSIIFEDEVTMDKKKYGVEHASIHKLDIEKKLIKRIY